MANNRLTVVRDILKDNGALLLLLFTLLLGRVKDIHHLRCQL